MVIVIFRQLFSNLHERLINNQICFLIHIYKKSVSNLFDTLFVFILFNYLAIIIFLTCFSLL